MSVTGAEGPPDDPAYIRAGGGVAVNAAAVVGVLVWLLVAALFGLAAYFGLSAANHDSRLNLLRDSGVPVQATVIGCTAVSSGVGMGIEYWSCRGSYTLGGLRFAAPLGGNRRLLDAGTTLAAVTVRGHPDLLWTAAAVEAGHSSTTGYTAAGVLAAVGFLGGAGRLFVVRRHRSA